MRRHTAPDPANELAVRTGRAVRDETEHSACGCGDGVLCGEIDEGWDRVLRGESEGSGEKSGRY